MMTLLRVFHVLFKPFTLIFVKMTRTIMIWLGNDPNEVSPYVTAEDIEYMIDLGSREGTFSEDRERMLRSVFEFNDTSVREIMVPRTEMVAFASSMTPADLLEEVLNDRFTRVPIYEETIDNVLGVVHLKDLIKHARTGATSLQGILNPVIRVPERKGILDLLADMQRGFNHVAIVKDEFAITQGMVTQEDILEEIVGEIRDEFDSEELHEVRRLSDGSYDVLARVSVLDFNRKSNWEIAAERGDTLGGLLFNTLERAPRKGEVVHLPGYDLQCLDVSGSRITRVRVTERPEEATK